jgi:crooked neck
MSRNNAVKNRAPAPIQISAEQILREAADRQEPHTLEPVVKVHDAEEYQSHLRDRRKHFEDNIRYRREHIGNWVKYARFEEDNKEFERARSVFERALEVDGRSGELYLRYAEFEMRNEFVNRARNVLDRGVQILPRIDFLWYKYVFMEEMVGDIPKCRAVFERWMKWMPDDNAWMAFAKFETRHGFPKKAEAIMRNYVNAYPSVKSFCKFAKWAEYEAKDVALARTIYESALVELEPEESKQARLFDRFANFEERHGEYERSRVIYKHAISLLHLGEKSDHENDDISDYERKKRDELYKNYIAFEKKHGDRAGIENVILTKQRAEYQQRISEQPMDYNAWFEWAKLEESANSKPEEVREIYERAVANIPPTKHNKDHWRRYIYLWIYYAVYEECTNHDLERASQVYETCLSIIPHANFTFSKIWIYTAKLYVRRRDLTKCRKLLGKAIGVVGLSKKEKIFQEYIALESALGEIDRCRALYTNYVKAMPDNGQAWAKFAGLEQSVGETERCRAIYELAISQPKLDMPEILWKSYIDFEMSEGEADKARNLYERLLERTGHVKVWISYAQFEATPLGRGIKDARAVFEKAYQRLKEEGLSEERVLLLDAWRALEKQQGDTESIKAVEARLPRRIKRKRMRHDDQGNEMGWEEYFDYHFPDDDDAAAPNNFKILEMAAKWKKLQQQQQESEDDDSSAEE